MSATRPKASPEDGVGKSDAIWHVTSRFPLKYPYGQCLRQATTLGFAIPLGR
jgi:hypothetical protein